MTTRTFLALAAMLGVALLLLATPACDDDDDDECCPMSAQLVCTHFLVGGAKSLQGGYCGGGMTDNLYSVIHKKVDAKGCPYWEFDPSSPRTCGTPIDVGRKPPNTGPDGSDDEVDDADAGDAGDAGDDGGDGGLEH